MRRKGRLACRRSLTGRDCGWGRNQLLQRLGRLRVPEFQFHINHQQAHLHVGEPNLKFRGKPGLDLGELQSFRHPGGDLLVLGLIQIHKCDRAIILRARRQMEIKFFPGFWSTGACSRRKWGQKTCIEGQRMCSRANSIMAERTCDCGSVFGGNGVLGKWGGCCPHSLSRSDGVERQGYRTAIAFWVGLLPENSTPPAFSRQRNPVVRRIATNAARFQSPSQTLRQWLSCLCSRPGNTQRGLTLVRQISSP